MLLVIAVGGATLFGNAESFAELLLGRAMIGLGVAAALMAGLKAIVIWFPRERIALVNGCMIMLGSLGAVTATAPTDWVLDLIGWRNLFEVLTAATLATAGLIYLVVPERDPSPKRFRNIRKTAHLAFHLFGSAFPENCTAFSDLHRIVLGVAVIMGGILAGRRGRT